MHSERHTARLKRRAERLIPSSQTHTSSSTTNEINSSISRRRPPLSTSSTTADFEAATASALAAVSASRRNSSARSPRDINMLVEKLLAKVHGSPSAAITRRTVVRLHEPVSSTPQTDVIKRKVAADAQQVNGVSPAETVTQLHEVFSRFVKLKNLDKKTEALVLLYGLTNSVGLPTYNEDGHHRDVDFATEDGDDSVGHGAIMSGMKNSETDKAGGLQCNDPVQSMPTASPSFKSSSAACAFSSTGQSKTDLDSLEDSFKFAVGIAPIHKVHRRKGSSTRTSSDVQSVVVSGAASAPANRAGQSSFDVPEEVLLRDVLYALQAIESRYLYFDNALDRFQITRSVGVPTPMRELIYMLCDLGWLYRNISAYIKQHREMLAFGLVGQSFCHMLHTELVVYFRLIAILAAQIDEDAETRQPSERAASSLTLRTLTVWTQDAFDKMRLMARLIDRYNGCCHEAISCKRVTLWRTMHAVCYCSAESLRGGALASSVHSHVLHGDPDVSTFVQAVLKQTAAPIVQMIKRWVFEGELEDVHVSEADSTVSDDQFWAKKYTLNLKMLPTFIPISMRSKSIDSCFLNSAGEFKELVRFCVTKRVVVGRDQLDGEDDQPNKR
uniref:Gamma tubulin complex component protein N-terminal domain-containing protein n=1 Tax=Hyaloperonospora arabidopsidis (strain Emoy2) TaxID=559515 RepID=M4BDP4_HYAAE